MTSQYVYSYNRNGRQQDAYGTGKYTFPDLSVQQPNTRPNSKQSVMGPRSGFSTGTTSMRGSNGSYNPSITRESESPYAKNSKYSYHENPGLVLAAPVTVQRDLYRLLSPSL